MTLETSSALNDEWEASSEDVVYALAASPQFDRDGVCFAGRASGLYRSANGGASWQPAYATLNLSEDLSTSAVVVSPDFASDRAVFAGSRGPSCVRTMRARPGSSQCCRRRRRSSRA